MSNSLLTRFFLVPEGMILALIMMISGCRNQGPPLNPANVIVLPENVSLVNSFRGEDARLALFPQDPTRVWALVETNSMGAENSTGSFAVQSWAIPNGNLDVSIPLSVTRVSGFAFAKTQARLVFSSSDPGRSSSTQFSVVDLPSGHVVSTTLLDGANVCLKISPDGSHIFILMTTGWSGNYSAYLWQPDHGKIPDRLSFPPKAYPDNMANSVLFPSVYTDTNRAGIGGDPFEAFSDDAMRVVIDSSEGTIDRTKTVDGIGVWDLSSQSWVFKTSFPYDAYESRTTPGTPRLVYFRFSRAGTKLITVHQGSASKQVEYKLWDLTTGVLSWSYQAEPRNSGIVEFSADDTRVLLPNFQQGPVLLNTSNGEVIRSFGKLSSETMFDVHQSADQSKFVGAFGIASGQLWDTNTGDILARLDPPTDITPIEILNEGPLRVYCEDHQFTGDGRFVVAKGENAIQNFICIFDMAGF